MRENNPALAAIMAQAMLSMIAARKGQTPHAPDPDPVSATTNTISPEEKAEMERAPRAYRRRMLRELNRKVNI
jgi:MoxR-like ATPase